VGSVKPRLAEVGDDQFEAATSRKHEHGLEPSIETASESASGSVAATSVPTYGQFRQDAGDHSHSMDRAPRSSTDQNRRQLRIPHSPGTDQHVAADAAGRVVESLRHQVQLTETGSRKTRFLRSSSLEQHEIGKNDDDSGLSQRRKERACPVRESASIRLVAGWTNLNAHGRSRRGLRQSPALILIPRGWTGVGAPR